MPVLGVCDTVEVADVEGWGAGSCTGGVEEAGDATVEEGVVTSVVPVTDMDRRLSRLARAELVVRSDNAGALPVPVCIGADVGDCDLREAGVTTPEAPAGTLESRRLKNEKKPPAF